MVGRPLAKEFDGFIRLFILMVGIITVGLALAAVIAWRLVFVITRPIKSLAEMVASIDHRELDRRLPQKQPTLEMTVLAGRFNAMIGDLQSAFDKQRKFTFDAAHELRTPLAIISGQCELSLSKQRDHSHYCNAHATCRDAAVHMSGLVNQLLLLSRLDDNPKPQVRTAVRLDHVIANVVDLVTPLANQREIRIELSIESISVNADESQIRQVLLNLLDNAIQFSHRDGTITVLLRSDGINACINVGDNGIGIATGDLPHLCDRFFQVDQARTTTQSSGSGLGLSIVSELVKQVGGTLSIRSEQGVGTDICVIIPAVTSPVDESDLNPVT